MTFRNGSLLTRGTHVLMVTVLTGVLSLASAGSASAATCDAASCAGRSPVGTTCANDARTLDSFNLVSGEGGSYGNVKWKVELRYSPSCRASWARATGKWYFSAGALGFTLQLGSWARLDPATPVSTSPIHYRAERYISSSGLPSFQFSAPMVPDTASYQVRACSSAYVGSPCTPYQHL